MRSTNGISFGHLATTSANSTSYSDTGVAASTTYYYQVRAYDAGGYSAVSNTAITTTYNVPIAPSNLLVSSNLASSTWSAILNWNDNSSNETGFVIERAIGTSTFSFLASTTANTVSYTDSPLSAGVTYSYLVYAMNSYGNSTYSNTASTTTIVPTPNAPTNLSATATTSSAVIINWTDNSNNESGFVVERSLDGSTWGAIATTSVNATNYDDAGLNPATTYYYRVRAFNGSGYSGYTNTAAATTLDTVPLSPSGLGATATTSSSVGLNWTDNSSNEQGFAIGRSLRR